jgi:hypothetical protein
MSYHNAIRSAWRRLGQPGESLKAFARRNIDEVATIAERPLCEICRGWLANKGC